MIRDRSKGAPNRHITLISFDPATGVQHTFHATKGHRWSKRPVHPELIDVILGAAAELANGSEGDQ